MSYIYLILTVYTELSTVILSQEEILFLKDCMETSFETLAMPCMLLQRNTGSLEGLLDVIAELRRRNTRPAARVKAIEELCNSLYRSL